MEYTVEKIRDIIEEQFLEYKNYEITPVLPGGHDNRTFRLGDNLSIRIPSDIVYAKQIAKEFKCLPMLSKFISIEITSPISMGKPTLLAPFPFTINKWLDGDTLDKSTTVNLESAATDLNLFLKELQQAPLVDEIECGIENCYRGCNLEVYDLEVRQAIHKLMWDLPAEKLLRTWNEALKSGDVRRTWIHGDMSVKNILIKNSKLKAVIDFGQIGIGDPSCDYVLAWTYFSGKSRDLFLADVNAEEIKRAKGWALWKALITIDAKDLSSSISNEAITVIKNILGEC